MIRKSLKGGKGFTLIELSIVLVIIGLVVGGIMVGRSMIRSSEIKSIGADLERFEAARMTFRTKYNCLAGDCSSALSLGLGNNGNGNGYVNHYAASAEVWLFWKHLSNAELITGNYSGLAGPVNNTDAVTGYNVPSSTIPSVGYSLYTPAPLYTSFSPTLDGYGLSRPVTDSMYIIGTDNPSNEVNTTGGFILSVEAKAFDDKYDDGLANNGKIRTSLGGAATNTVGCTSGAAPNYSYTTSSTALCNLQYWFRNF